MTLFGTLDIGRSTRPCDCGHHHWDGGSPTGRFEFRSRSKVSALLPPDANDPLPDEEFFVKAEKEFRCQHDGCFVTETRWCRTLDGLDEEQWEALRDTLMGTGGDGE